MFGKNNGEYCTVARGIFETSASIKKYSNKRCIQI